MTRKGSSREAERPYARGIGVIAKCWELFQGLPRDVSRKEALRLCEVHGINRNTAKTQWQRFIEQTNRERGTPGRPTMETTPANGPA
jgi:hypothetical protein